MRNFFLVLAAFLSLPYFSIAQEGAPKEGEWYEYEGPIKTPEEIQRELEEDERLFKRAQEMFDPWYAGPLLTGGAHMMPPGYAVVQPYLFVTDTYAVWNSERKSKNIHDIWSVNPVAFLQWGLAKWLDMYLVMQGFANWQHGKVGGGYGDMTLGVGFPILTEDLKRPAIKFIFSEVFPTGKYQHLNPRKNGLDSTGGGSFQSLFGLRISKIFFWSHKHPVNLRALYNYVIPSDVHVRNFNTYGGGYGTAGKVSPGNYQQVDVAGEYSFTQKWVAALDVVYTWSNKTSFHGTPGKTSSGSTASVGKGSSDQLSFAPAIEYNPTAYLNFIGGVWFDVYGRNTGKFVSYILSMAYTFGVSKGK